MHARLLSRTLFSLAAAFLLLAVLPIAQPRANASTTSQRVTDVAAGEDFSCALLENNTVKCWGRNGAGQLGFSSTYAPSADVAIPGISNAKAVTAGDEFACALLQDNSVKCWGYNNYGQIGTGGSFPLVIPEPTTVAGLSGVTAISAGSNHACAVVSDGTAKCWGYNSYGQIGNGTTTVILPPTAVTGLTNVTKVAAGANFSCAVHGGAVSCWGYNNFGQLGNGSTADSNSPVAVTGLAGATDVVVGIGHACALMQDATAKCWGLDSDGQLGNGDEAFTPGAVVSVAGLSGITALTAGNYHNCAVLQMGFVKCWGYNQNSELGIAASESVKAPTDVTGISTASRIDAGDNHTCVALIDGSAKCWGQNADRQLNTGVKNSTNAIEVPNSGTGAFAASKSGPPRACIIASDSNVACWGSNYIGAGVSPTPVVIPNTTGAQAIAAGYNHACALMNDTTVRCWGKATSNGTDNNTDTAAEIAGLTGVTKIAAGDDLSCAVLADKTVKCWGSLTGTSIFIDADATTSSQIPVVVKDLTNVRDITIGGDFACAVLEDATARCWGSDSNGAKGDGAATSPGLVTVTGISGISSLSAGGRHACALLQTGDVSCWGLNSDKQAGQETGYEIETPTPVTGLSNISSISAGDLHTCVMAQDAAVSCWGANRYGERGSGSATETHIAAPVPGVTGVSEVFAGTEVTFARTSAGAFKGWGYNLNAVLGIDPVKTSTSVTSLMYVGTVSTTVPDFMTTTTSTDPEAPTTTTGPGAPTTTTDPEVPTTTVPDVTTTTEPEAPTTTVPGATTTTAPGAPTTTTPAVTTTTPGVTTTTPAVTTTIPAVTTTTPGVTTTTRPSVTTTTPGVTTTTRPGATTTAPGATTVPGATTTTIANQGETPIAKPTVVTGKAVFVKPDGTTTEATVTNDGSRVKVGNDSQYFNVTLNNSAIAETNELTLQAGGQTTITGAGFKPGSKVEIWMFSTPTLLGTATADAAGAFSFSAAVPSEISGSHTLHVEGVDTADASFGIAYGVTVAAAKTEVPFTGPGLNLTLLFLALLCGAMGVAVRRRTLA